jgi:uncharacterized membrane protein YGL010W
MPLDDTVALRRRLVAVVQSPPDAALCRQRASRPDCHDGCNPTRSPRRDARRIREPAFRSRRPEQSERPMRAHFFRSQLVTCAEYHRDPRNCMTHYIGIPAIILAVLLPFALWPISLAGWQTSSAVVLLVLAVLGWMAIDLGVGAAMLVAIVPLFLLSEFIARVGGPVIAWSLAAVLFVAGWALQILGHAAYEGRRPALVDNLFQIFIGPMYMTAKILVALGLRSDLMDSLQAKGQ